MAVGAFAIAIEYDLTALGCLFVETALRRGGRWNSELVEVQRCELRCDDIGNIRHVPEARFCGNGKLRRIVQAGIEKRPFSMHFKIGNECVPICYGAPAGPSMKVDSS